MSSKFVIRNHHFGYNDEWYYITGTTTGAIHDNKADAEAAVRKLELKHAKDFNPIEFGAWDEYYSDTNDYKDRLHQFASDKTGQTVTEDNFFEIAETLHKSLSDDDLLEYINLTQSNGYKLVELTDENEPLLAVDGHTGKHFYVDDEFQSYVVAGFSQEEMHEHLFELWGERYTRDNLDEIGNADDDIPYAVHQSWDGSLDELSRSPALLQSLIESEQCLSYDADTLTITNPEAPQLFALNALLATPIFEFKPITIDELKTLEKTADKEAAKEREDDAPGYAISWRRTAWIAMGIYIIYRVFFA